MAQGGPWVWARLDGLEGEPALTDAATAAIESGVDALVVAEAQAGTVRDLAMVRVIEGRGHELLEGGEVVGRIVEVRSSRDVSQAIEAMGRGLVALVVTGDWTVIPLEDLVAARRGEGLPGRLLAQARTAKEAQVALGALEHGVDGVAVVAGEGVDLREVLTEVRAMATPPDRLELTTGKVTHVEQLGMGDRACVDTVDLLEPGEGLLVGSSSQGFLLVHGETVENPYAAVRPFRVNAGAVHSYVFVPGGRTRYLSEARTGSLVLVVGRDGLGRSSHVGRLKIERRPLVLIEVEAEGRAFSAILQNAETVRLVTPAGHASVRALRPGDEVIVHLPAGAEAPPQESGRGARGRHFGRAVSERVVEG
jgi:3-dehydroquinate synthase II